MSEQSTEVEDALVSVCEQAVQLLDALRPWECLTEGQRNLAVRLTLSLATLAAYQDSTQSPSEVSPSS